MPDVQLALGFLFDLGVALLIVRGIYYSSRPRKEYVLAFLTLNTVVFLISSLLGGVDLSVGFGFSLFAIFSLLRYRTDPIPVREITYLFVLMSLPVIDAVLLRQDAYAAMLIANAVTLLVLYVVERGWGCQYESRKPVTYEKIELIRPENYDRLLADLRDRTGLPVTRCQIGRIDLMRDVAEITVYYQQEPLRLAHRRASPPTPATAREARAIPEWGDGDGRS
ncbi:MAG: DUF4956 domain-containing protein [Anaerolineae bacterium]|nr:DUF4956 domain-containing protein [Anaerolineae bacterium]